MSGPGADSEAYGILGRCFDSSGAALGPELQVNSFTTDEQWVPRVAVGAAGGFVVVWQSGDPGPDGDGYAISGQRFAFDGTALGGEFQANTYATDDQTYPDVAADAAGNFVGCALRARG
jgi:hypothetical protein